jgi:NhaP-type Na+/H+ or K+/H+ antiporter
MKDVNIEELMSFRARLTVVLISMLFILLAARLDINQLISIGLPVLAVLAVGLPMEPDKGTQVES